MIITHKITMELTRYNILSSIDVMQSDKYSRNLEVTLLASGQPWEIPEDATILIRYRKADGTGGEYDTLPDDADAYSFDGNVVTVALAPQVCTVVGPVALTVAILQGTAEINTFVINLDVRANPGTNVAGSEGYYYNKSLEERIAGLEANVAYSTLTLNAEAVEYLVTMDVSQFNVVPKAGDWAISVNNMLYRVYEVEGTTVTLTRCCSMQGTAGADGADGQDGEDGTDGLTPYIGENGNWWIGETDTGVAAGGNAANITIDDALSETSENPVQNKVVTAAFNEAMVLLSQGIIPRILPEVAEADNGKILQVLNGSWVTVALTDVSEVGM